MIFEPEFVALVLAGRKTQTRRRVKWPPRPMFGDEPLPCRYQPGRTYAVQAGRGQKAVGRILVLDVSRVPVATISQRDAEAEGFGSSAAFLTWWEARYREYSGDCWRIRFKLVGAS